MAVEKDVMEDRLYSHRRVSVLWHHVVIRWQMPRLKAFADHVRSGGASLSALDGCCPLNRVHTALLQCSSTGKLNNGMKPVEWLRSSTFCSNGGMQDELT